jgi:hypothetical protein
VRRTHRSARGPGTPPLSATPSTSVGIMLQPDRNAALMQLGAEIPYVSVASGGEVGHLIGCGVEAVVPQPIP